MRLTVLGSSPSWPDAGGACSGYLVQDSDTTLLVDCGSGVFAKLRERMDYVDLDAIVISHLHADHLLDLVPYAHALTYAPRQQRGPVDRWPGTDSPARPLLHVPPGGRETFRALGGTFGAEPLIENAFDVRVYAAGDTLTVGPLRVRFQEVPHYVPTFAMSIGSENGSGRIVYGADCSPTHALDEFAAAADVLIVEATLPRPERTGVRGHLTAAEAGQLGRAAGARRLVLTHVSDELDRVRACQEAEATFGGPVEHAAEGAVFEV